MRYFLFAMAACMLLACNGQKLHNYDMQDVLQKNTTKDLSADVRIDDVHIFYVDTVTKKELLANLLQDKAKELNNIENGLRIAKETYDTMDDFGKILSDADKEKFQRLELARHQTILGHWKESKVTKERELDSIRQLSKDMKDEQLRAYEIHASMAYSLESVRDTILIAFRFWDGQDMAIIPNILLPEIAMEKWSLEEHRLLSRAGEEE